jgi:hypothetical protein
MLSKHVMVKVSLFLINYAPCHTDGSGSGCIVPPLLTLAIDRAEWSD